MRVCPFCQTCFEDAGDRCPEDATILEAPISGSTVIDGKYVLESRLGQGGMGAVYRARHAVLNKSFALKLIRPPAGDVESFAHLFKIEAQALGKLKHPNIVDVTDYGVDPRDGGLPYLVMEYLQGETLRQRIRDQGPLPLAEFLPLLDQIAQAVDYAHQQGVLHCDLKPANIFLSQTDRKARSAKILDFGLAQLIQSGLPGSEVDLALPDSLDFSIPNSTSDATTLSYSRPEDNLPRTVSGIAPRMSSHRKKLAGTPAYMPPEVIQGSSPTIASDIYALGVLIYEVISGQRPFTGSLAEILAGHLHSIPPKPSFHGISVPDNIDQALLAPLEKTPSRRPGSAGEIVRKLRSAHHGAERRRWLAREMPRRLWIALALAIALGALLFPLLHTEPANTLEWNMVDARFAYQPKHPSDPRILLVSIDDASLAEDQKLISGMADEFGMRLEHIFSAGAEGIAIDFLLPPTWSRSESFSRLVLNHTSDLTLAAFASSTGEIVGTSCLGGFTAAALGPERLNSLFGFVNLDEDSDGVTRRARGFLSNLTQGRWDSWAMRAALSLPDVPRQLEVSDRSGEFFWIDGSADWQKMERLSWRDVPRSLQANPALFRNRLVLIGGDYAASGDDFHRVPGPRGFPRAVSGLMLESLIVNTILADFPIREAGRATACIAVILVCALAVAGMLCIRRLSLCATLFVIVNALYVTTAFLLFRWFKLLVPVASPLAMGFIALGISLALRSRLPAFPSPHYES